VWTKNHYKRKMEEGEGGGEGNEWKQSIPEQLRDAPFFKEAKSMDEVVAGIAGAAQYMGNSIRIPGDDAGAEDLAEFHAKLSSKVPGLIPTPDFTDPNSVNEILTRMGRPSSDKGYKFPDGMEPDEYLAKVAFDNSLTQNQFDGFVKTMNESTKSETEANQLAQRSNILELKKEWGLAYEDKAAEVSALLKIMEAPPHIAKAFQENNLDTSLVKWFSKITDSLGGEGTQLGKKDESKTGISPAEADIKIAEINANSQHPYWNPQMPGHENAKKVFQEYMTASLGSGG